MAEFICYERSNKYQVIRSINEAMAERKFKKLFENTEIAKVFKVKRRIYRLVIKYKDHNKKKLERSMKVEFRGAKARLGNKSVERFVDSKDIISTEYTHIGYRYRLDPNFSETALVYFDNI